MSLGESLELCWSRGSGWPKWGRGWEQLHPEGNLGMARHRPDLHYRPAAHNRSLCFVISSPAFSFSFFIVSDSPLGCDVRSRRDRSCALCVQGTWGVTEDTTWEGNVTLPHLWCHCLKKMLHHAKTLPSSPSRCCSLVTHVKAFCFASVLPRKV